MGVRTAHSAASSTVPVIWGEVQDELRSRQALSSVTNTSLRGKSIFRQDLEGINDLVERIKDSVEELNEQRENEAQEAADAAALARTEELLGYVPQVTDFQPYLETFSDLWDVYYRNNQAKINRARRRGQQEASRRDALDDDAACDAHHAVPPEYFQSDFKLEHHSILKQPLQSALERQEEFNAELTGHLDTIEVSLFEHIRRAQRDQLFETLARMGDPLQEDLKATLTVVAALRQQLHSVQRRQLQCGLAVGRLARRKTRVAEVLQRLECLTHVREALPSIQMLMQGGDYVTALDLLESTKSASDTHLKGLSCVKPGNAKLASLGSAFDRVVEADFVQHSMEAVMGGPSGTAPSGDTSPVPAGEELPGADRVRRLCRCLARRSLLKTALSGTLRDLLLSQVKKVIKQSVQELLEAALPAGGQAGGATSSSASAAAVNGAGTDGPAGPEAANEAAAAAVAASEPQLHNSQGITKALKRLDFEAFLDFWRQLLQVCIDVAGRLCAYAALISVAAREPDDEAFSAAHANAVGGEEEVGVELLRLFEVTMDSMLKKVGVLAQAREDEHKVVKIDDWPLLLTTSYEALDKIKALQDSILPKACKESQGITDVRSSMKAVLYAQTKGIIEEFHQARMAQIQCVVEQERWEKTDVPAQYRHKLDQLTGQVSDATASGAAPGEQPGAERNIRFDGITFHVVPAVLTLVQILADYMQLCREFHSQVGEIAQRMAQLLRLYNSQVQRLLLGGQLTKQSSGTKKSITAQNLALCSQSCGLVAQILPKMQTQLLGILNGQENGTGAHGAAGLDTSSGASGGGSSRQSLGAALVAELTKIASEFCDHRAALYSKLSVMLRERYDFHAKKWWSSPHPEAPAGRAPWDDGVGPDADVELTPHEAVEGLARDIVKMYQFILRVLSGESVRRIFSKAFEDIAARFEQHLGQELSAPAPPYEAKPGRSLGDRLALDVVYLREQLGKLTAAATPINRLVCDLMHHLQTRLSSDEPLKRLQPVVVEVLQRTGRIPQ